MKKSVVSSSILKIAVLSGTALLLTSCIINWPDPIFGPSTESKGGASGDTYTPDAYTYTDEDAPEGYPDKVAAKYTYSDYIKNNNYNLSSAPTIGSPKFLVIPVWFSDSNTFVEKAKRENVRDDIRKAYFGTEEETGWESAKTYYYKDSFGKCTIDGVVTDWYEISDSYKKYGPESSGGSATSELVKSAVTWYKDKYKVSNMSDFDYDKDGYIDGVMLIYAAPDYDTMENNSFKNLWAYCYWLQKTDYKNVSNPGPNAFFWASYDFMYGEAMAQTRTGKNYGGGDTSHSKIDAHTYIHEMGHVFGLEDYYDYTNTYSAAAGFSMQDCNVGGHDPYSRFALGWTRPYVPTETCTLTVKNMESSGECVLLSADSFSGSPFSEYMLIELYTPTGLNKFDSLFKYRYPANYPMGPAVPGVRIWHIDARLWSNSARRLTDTPSTGKVTHATSNSAKDDDYGTNRAGSYDYNIIQLIRNGILTTYKSKADLTASDLFKTGSTYNQDTLKKQFVNGTLMNDNKALGWTIKFGVVTSESMTLTLTRVENAN